jgi:ubiquinone/menaquinone biosynthesis C-methylase UbiE
MENQALKEIEIFWEKHLCGSHFVANEKFTPEFFQNYHNYRYNKEHHLLKIVPWESAEGKDVLEIGLGIGADSIKWAMYAKSFTGIDLTLESVKATREHLQLMGMAGVIMQGNAEQLSFLDESFDIVYSHGVLHHTSDIDKAFSEIYRVLRPGGQFIIMLYTPASFNY